MNQQRKDRQHGFLVRCEQAHHLVQSFLHDTAPWGPVPPSKPHYVFDPQHRSAVKLKVRKSLDVLSAAIDRHGLDELAISYNGGKDCLVMLILFLAAIHMKFSSDDTANPSLNLLPPDYKLDSIYVNSEIPFPEVTKFIMQSTEYYHLNPIMVKSSLKDGFEHYLEAVNPHVKCIVVGIRYSDPYGSQLQYEQVTDHNWPRFLRIHPILHWHYVDIWDFIVGCNLDYCSMYDEGYTSLGGIRNTLPNPYLKGPDGYLPAYMLTDDADEKERLGRMKKPETPQSPRTPDVSQTPAPPS